MKRYTDPAARLRYATAIVACMLLTSSSATAQQPTDAGQQTQSARTGDGLLSIETSFPKQVRASEQFDFEVTVTNSTDNMVLHDIKLKHQGNQSISIESVKSGDQASNSTNDKSQSTDEGNSQSSSGETSAANSKGTEKSNAQNKNSLTIAKLEPGASKTLKVTASADQEGAANACLVIESYMPALCLQTQVVKPDLKITKTAPDRVTQCDVIELTYTVTNDGTGPVGEFEIIDELSDGIKTIDDQNRLAFKVDNLRAGDSRRFVARVFATKTGEFKSRAMAQASQSELKSRSQNVGPQVVGTDLEVNVESNGTVYSSRPAMFTARIKNHGNAAADDVRVQVRWPEKARLVNISSPRLMTQQDSQQSATTQENSDAESNQSANAQADTITEQKSSSDSNNNSNDATNAADRQTANHEQNSRAKQLNEEMAEEEMTIDRLEPGQTAEFTYTIAVQGMDQVPTRVEATSICTIEGIQDSDQADVRTTAQGMATAEVIRLPSLQVYALDDVDPVPTNKQVTYTINVKNEGDASDNKVQVTATLPDELEFESAEGPTKHEQSDNRITFDPIDKLEGGQDVGYTITATAKSEGNVKLQVQLESDALRSTVRVAEPTQLFNAQASN